MLAGGKRLRPILVLAAADAVAAARGATEQARALALPAACALEMIHTYSLIHDDLPAMDDDSLRRGRPTLHVVAGDGMAILAGDGLQAEAFALLAREPVSDDASLVEPQAAGAGAGGDGRRRRRHGRRTGHRPRRRRPAGARQPAFDAATLADMHARKTGALIRAAAVAGAVMAGGDGAMETAVDAWASEVGLAFQIVDDVLDVEGAAADIGKTSGKDAAAGKPTYPALFGLGSIEGAGRRGGRAGRPALTSAGLGWQPPAGHRPVDRRAAIVTGRADA